MSLNLILRRRPSNAFCTIGDLYNEKGALICYTLEDVVRDEKIKGETAIPQGTYKVTITHSKRFDRPLPLLNNVPNFEGIRIHPGNGPEDTEGCILPGMSVSPDETKVLESRYAFTKLFDLIDENLRGNKEVWIEVRNG